MNTRRSAPSASQNCRSAPGLGRLWRENGGVAAVEFAFVLPVLVILLAGMIQFGLVLFTQHNMGEVTRETARRVAVGALTQTQAVQFAEDQLVGLSTTFDIDVTVPDPSDPTDTDVEVVITAPMEDVAVIDILGILEGRTLHASSTMREE